jgi:Phosphatidylinositol-specific phospholipase C, X domain
MRFSFLFIFLLGKLIAQCNGDLSLCQKRYNEVTYLTTHNAFNSADHNYMMPNQNFGVTQQLNDGVRGLMLDVYDSSGTVVVYHGIPFLGSQHLSEIFSEIKTFLDSNANEIVTVIFESYVSASAIDSEMLASGLLNYAFAKQNGMPWPTLQEMIDSGKRLVIFSDVNDAGVNQNWYHFVWDYAVETHYSVHDTLSFTNDFNRGDSMNDLFIFNHFITDVPLGFGSPNDAAIINSFAFLSNRLINNFNEKHKFPNFITLDFYDSGDGFSVVNWINSGVLSVSGNSDYRYSIYPNPATESLHVKTPFPFLSFSITDTQGQVLNRFQLDKKGEAEVSLQLLPGFYFLRFENGVSLPIVIRD